MKPPFFIFFALITMGALNPGLAQEHYSPLKAKGPIPDDFLAAASEKYYQDAEKIAGKSKQRTKKLQQQFYLESNFSIHELLWSGSVLFNDPVTGYLNKITDYILQDNPELRKEIRVYSIRSASVNAFSTDQGMLFVNLGLIGQLENEAQLAFILCHEIAHYKNGHSMSQYLETKKIKRGKGVYKKTSLEEKVLARHRYSREHETEADLKGFELFSRLDYDPKEAVRALNILQYTHLPIDDVPFSVDFLTSRHFNFPDSYFLDNVSPITDRELEDDSKSTHPNVYKRKQNIFAEVEKSEKKKVGQFFFPEDAFEEARKTCRFEMARIYLMHQRYELAVYHCYVLLQKYPGDRYLETCLLKALYGIMKYCNRIEFRKIHVDHTAIEGESQQVYYWMDQMEAGEVNILALRQGWKLKQQYPDDAEIRSLTDEIFRELVEYHYVDSDFFHASERQFLTEQDEVPDKEFTEEDYERMSKYEKIEWKKKQEAATGKTSYIRYAFIDFLRDDPSFATAYQKLSEEKEVKGTLLVSREIKNHKEQRKVEKKGYALGINKVVIIDPAYLKMDQRKSTPVRYIASEAAQKKFNKKVENSGRKAGIAVEVLDTKRLQAADIEWYNEYALMNQWLSEITLRDPRIGVKPVTHYAIKKIAAKHGTDYFSWMGAISIREKKQGQVHELASGILFFPYLPWALYTVIKPKYDTYYFCLVYEVSSARLVMKEVRYIDYKDRRDILNSTLYYTFQQMKQKR